MSPARAPWEIVRFALRALAHRRKLAFAILFTLALGLGATTLVVSVGQSLLAGPPYPGSDRLLVVSSVREETGAFDRISFPDFRDLAEAEGGFGELAAWSDLWDLNLNDGRSPERARVRFVSASYFPILGVTALHGRTFLPDEDRPPAGAPVAVLSHRLWRKRWGGAPGAIGSSLRLGDHQYTVVGVLPAGFREFTPEGSADVWLPVTVASRAFTPAYLEMRGHRWLSGLGRLRSGVSPAQAREAAAISATRLAALYPASHRGIGIDLAPLASHAFGRRDLRRTTLVLGLGAAFVLLVGCVNVANLLLADYASRRRELAVRLALGAGKWHLVGQLLLECLLLALGGGAAGVLLAYGGLRWLAVASPLPLPPYVELAFDSTTLLAAIGLSLVTTLLVGLVPALSALGVNLREVLSQNARSVGQGVGLARRLLVTLQVAAALALLVGAGLLIRSLLALNATGYGFDVTNLWTLRLTPSDVRYASDDSLRALLVQLEDAAEGVPGVEQAFLWGPGRAGASEWYREVVPEGRIEGEPDGRCQLFEHRVSPDALAGMGFELRSGRFLEPADRSGALPVAVVSESAARSCWPGEEPLGKRFRRGGEQWFTVVGVVEDVYHRGRAKQGEPAPDAYYTLSQMPTSVLTLLVRTRRSDEGLLRELQSAVFRVDPDLPLFDVATFRSLQQSEEVESRFFAFLLGGYAGAALLLAAIGLYGILSYLVRQREREIGICLALGARRDHVTRKVAGDLLAFVALGLLAGLLAARALGATLAHLLFQVEAGDPRILLSLALLLLLVCLAALAFPLRRAFRIDPAEALRRQ